jgi:multidrug resistance efflux pump
VSQDLAIDAGGAQRIASAPPIAEGGRTTFSVGRITRIGLAIAVLAAGAAVYGPQLLFTTSDNAVLNARIITIAAPIEGRIAQTPPPEGTVVAADAPLLTIENPIVDRSRLEELEATRTRTEAELAGETQLLQALTTQISGLDQQMTAYLAATVTRLSLTQKEAQSDAAAAAASAAEARHSYERKRALRASNTISLADIDQAEQAAIRTEAVAERARFTAQRLGEEVEAARRGILVGADRNDVPYSQQRIDEFRVKKLKPRHRRRL